MNPKHSTTIHIGKNLLPFSVIVAASKENVEAINMVIKHYEPYMNKLSLRLVYDESGVSHMIVDEYTRRRLETKLITAIQRFKLN